MLDTQGSPASPVRHADVLPAPFVCSWTEEGGDGAWLRVEGELDVATSAQFEGTLSAAQRQARLVVVDLRLVGFADTSALHALLDADARAQRDCCRLVILRGPPRVSRIFDLCGVSDALEIVDFDAGEPAAMTVRRLAAEERDLGSAGAVDRLRATG